MKLLSAKEVSNITKESIQNNVLDFVMEKIIIAAKNGLYCSKIRSDYSKQELDIISTTLRDLGYDVQIETLTGALKFTDIIIHWND